MNKQMIYNCMPYGLVKNRIEFKPSFAKEAMEAPQLFNADGDSVKIFYLKDKGCAHTPYTMVSGRFPKQILWDRYNSALPIHFYTQSDVLERTLPCKKKFATLRESEAILPLDYKMALQSPNIMREYTKIFTHSARILEKYDNAIFAPASGVWYATERNGGGMDANNYQKKKRNVSIVASGKSMCEMHKVRLHLAKKYRSHPLVDAYGEACGNYIEKKADALETYRYSIAVENDITPFYFTEKIMDCFAAMTVPIYIGATEIGKYFNLDGIIQVKIAEYDSLDDILGRCCKEDYEARKEAIIDNYNRVQEFLCFEDYVMKYYGQLFE